MKKIIALLLTLVMIVSVFVGCNNGPAAGDNESGSEPEVSSSHHANESESPSESESDPKSDIYEELGITNGFSYGSKEINILHWDADIAEFGVDSDDFEGDPIAEAVYKRNLYTEELLGVDLVFEKSPFVGSSKDQFNAWCDSIESMSNDPSTPLDIFSLFHRAHSLATLRSLDRDVSSFDNLGLSKEWWPSNVAKDYSIKDKIYWVTGDLSTSMITNMYAVYFNKEMVEDDLFKLVNDKAWTVDKFLEMTQGFYQDLDQIQGKSAGDKLGMVIDYWQLNPIIHGAGFNILEASDQEDKYIAISEDFFGNEFGEFLGTLAEWGKTDDVIIDDTYSGMSIGLFREGRAAFSVWYLKLGFELQKTDIDYAVVPIPMLDPEAQKGEYVTTLADIYSLYSITKSCADGERAAAVLNALGYYGMKYSTPAVYNAVFKEKYSENETMRDMLVLIRDSIKLDLSHLYTKDLNYINDKPGMAVCKNQQWSVVMNDLQQNALKKYENQLNKNLDAVINA